MEALDCGQGLRFASARAEGLRDLAAEEYVHVSAGGTQRGVEASDCGQGLRFASARAEVTMPVRAPLAVGGPDHRISGQG